MSEDTANAKGRKIFIDLVVGYYHPTRKQGHSRLFSLMNAIRLAIRAY